MHEVTFWICNPDKPGSSGISNLEVPGSNPEVPVSLDFAKTCNAARRGRAGEGQGARARDVPGGGESHRRRHERRGATAGRRDDKRRRRAKALAGRPARPERGPDEEGNASRRGRRSFPREELRRGRPETTNRWRRRSSGRRQWWRGETGARV